MARPKNRMRKRRRASGPLVFDKRATQRHKQTATVNQNRFCMTKAIAGSITWTVRGRGMPSFRMTRMTM